MAYYLRYLPTEGELKVGGHTLWPKHHEGFFAGRICPVVESNFAHLHALGCRPWVLYMVTDEIDEGGEFYHEDPIAGLRTQCYNYDEETVGMLGGFAYTIFEEVYKHEWNHFHDVVLSATGKKPYDYELVRIFNDLSEELRNDAMEYGMNDTVWRDNVHDILTK